jgi:heptosyltransferase-2
MGAGKSALFIQTAFLGDLILSLPTVNRLKYLGFEVDLVCRSGLKKLALELGLFNRIYEVKKNDRSDYVRVQKELKHAHYNLLVSPHESFRSALFSFNLGTKIRIGYKRFWNFWAFNLRTEKDQALPEALRQMSLLQTIDPDLSSLLVKYKDEVESSKAWVVPQWANISEAVKFKLPSSSVKKTDLVVSLFPGSVWPTKRWTLEGFRDLARYFVGKGFTVLLLGSREEEEICTAIEKSIDSKEKIKNLAGRLSWTEVLAELSNSRVVVSNDSGGQHLASLVGTPTVVIFGPTVPEFGFRAWNSKSAVVQLEDLSCRPCGPHGHKTCPLGHHHCMRHLQSRKVIELMEEIISKQELNPNH